MSRKTSVAGTFYPNDAKTLEHYFSEFSRVYEEQATLPDTNTRAVIVPHAGYIYSGFSANIAYNLLARSGVKEFLVIGPSHRVAFSGYSICQEDGYDTPFGMLESSSVILDILKQSTHMPNTPQVHAEHSTEVQFPFVKHYMPKAKIVEVVYGRSIPEELSKLIESVLADERCGVIISTDLSHFYTLQEANQLDNICLEAIANLDIKKLHEGCEACGMLGVEAMLLHAKTHKMKAELLDYRTSADQSGDTNRVVGYVSAYFKED